MTTDRTMGDAWGATNTTPELDQRCIDTLRFLSVDMVQKAGSGHPGLPMGAAAFAYVLWTRFLRHNPANPRWANRDRFVLSAGHGSALLYSLLHLTGYDLPLGEIERFRRWGSVTPGHPESELTRGVEVTTGPLGQGLANAVGMAIAERYLASRFNRPGHEIVDHHTYALVGDGDLMEGVASEAASLAGHLKLGKLLVLYDDNRITLSAGTAMTFTEDRAKRFEAYGWHVRTVEDGNDLEAVDAALRAARSETERPSLILLRTHIGYGSPNKQDTFEAHGSPLGADEVQRAKKASGWPLEPPFYIPDGALAHFRQAVERGKQAEATWDETFAAYASDHPELARAYQQAVRGDVPAGWDADIPVFDADGPGMATRVASGKVLDAIRAGCPAWSAARPTSTRRRTRRWRRWGTSRTRRTPAATCRVRRAVDGATQDATCTSASASTPWGRSPTVSQLTVACSRSRPRSWCSPTTCARPFGWPPSCDWA